MAIIIDHMNTLQTRFGSGQEVRRLEDDALLAGQGQFTDDVRLEGQTRLCFVRSPHAHARIVGIDSAAARAMPGVRLILSGTDVQAGGVKAMAKPIMHKRADGGRPASPERHILAVDRVRFVGECVLAVVADTEQQARDAAEAVVVDYEALPHAVTLADALAPAAPLLSDAPDNRVAESRHGDAEQARALFAQARHVVRLDITNQRVAAVSIEPRSVQAYIEQGRLVVRMSSQMPTGIRTQIVDLIGLKEDQVRVLVGDVGGGFGMKTGAYPEDLVVAFCAHRLQRPVKWIAERSEDFLSSCHGRDIQCHGELALDAQGKILALRIDTQANVGAYPGMTGVTIQIMIGPWVQTSVYDLGCIDFHYTAVMTNTAPTGAYRGAGRPEAIFNIERLIDEAARVSGIDRLEIRRRSFIRPEQMPYQNPMGQTYDTGDFGRMMEQGLAVADWSGFAARAAESAARGMWRGLGIATFLEWTGGNAMEESVNVRIGSDGVIEVFSAVNQMGQGIATSLAQLVVDVFDLPISRVRVVLGDTDRGNGFGSAGSRSLFTGGSAISVGSRQALDKARTLAGQALEAAPADLVYAQGQFSVAGTDLKIGLAELAGRQAQGRIELDSKTAASGPTWPNGCHICEVELDPQTGEVAVLRYSSMNDVGRVVNPMIVRGQLDGGAVQGIGQALLEHMVYDPDSGQPVTGSLMDYAAPRADIMPAHFNTHTDSSVPSKNNVLGVKGVGELGTIGATPAVVNAVADALARHGRADLSPQLQMPLTPARLWALLRTRA